MKRFFCFLGMLCAFFWAGAQEKIGAKGLEAGDHVPDMVLRELINYRAGGTARISDFRGKLLILDFWSTYCGGCIHAMPQLDSVQRLYKDKVVILPVSFQPRELVAAFWKHNPMLRGLDLPSVVGDQELQRLFPHRLLPHDVWIDGNGLVLGATEAAEIDVPQIDAVLAGKPLPAREKRDVMNYDRQRPLLVGNNGGREDAFRYRSVITGYLEGLPGSLQAVTDTVKREIRVRATNVVPRALYALVYKELETLADSAITGDRKELIRYKAGKKGVQDTSRKYCYELILPGLSAKLARRSIKEDLDRFFGVVTHWDPVRKVFTVDRLDESYDAEHHFYL
ncbi:TlpA family protein disulfide reductase [Mucilaginibacter aquaedulcis]|uniref:TlpA family protein disulfide reductase n=1 Tax=Mucilaginibacter aquaedulcis TaxID=1187081 RepID=UPI0025B50C84|nr:TlpA disulfide reductase family protein [Mucilaginibacter aquaedulcis]MDN3548917.1 TlpA disulfide reductase family protein [Mucilaginibacter aquaedulcis]